MASFSGFHTDRCEFCGIHNDEIGGVMMQCSRCKQAVYCSMKCFNADGPRHSQFCDTGVLTVDNTHRGSMKDDKEDPNKVPVIVEYVKNDDKKGGRTEPQTIDTIIVQLDQPLKVLKDDLQKETGLPTTQQVLLLGNDDDDDGGQKELLGVQKKAKEHGITKLCTIYVEPKNIKLHVQMPKRKNGKKQKKTQFTVSISHRNTDVEDLKELVEDETGMDADNQILRLEKVDAATGDHIILEKGKKAHTLGLQHLDTIQVVPKAYQIKVQLPDVAKPVTVTVSHKDRGSDVIQKIRDKVPGMTGDDFLLFQSDNPHKDDKKGKPLPLDKRLTDAGVTDGDVLRLEPSKLEIAVTNTLTGETIQVAIDPSTDTVADLQQQVEQKTGLKPENQTWHNPKTGKALISNGQDPNTTTLEECDIGDSLELEPKEIEIRVDLPGKNRATVQVAPSDTLAEVKDKIEAKCGLAAAKQTLAKIDSAAKKVIPLGGDKDGDNQTVRDAQLRDGDRVQVTSNTKSVQVKLPDDTHIPLEVALTDTADEVKAKIDQKTDGRWKVPQQVLKDGKGREISGDKTAKEWGVKDGDYMVVQMSKIPVTIQPSGDGDPVEIMVDPAVDTIADIKNELERATGIPAKDQRLLKDGKELAKSKKTALECGIEAGTVLDLERKSIQMPVTNSLTGETIQVAVDPSTDTVAVLQQQVEQKTGLKPENQTWHNPKTGKALISDGQDPNTTTLLDCDIGDSLEFEPKEIEIRVDLPDKSRETVQVAPSDTLAEVKDKIEAKCGLAAAKQTLAKIDSAAKKVIPLGGDKDGDNQTVRDAQLQHGDRVQVTSNTKSVQVKLPDDTHIPLEVALTDTADQVKAKIDQKTDGRWNVPRQVLKDGKGREISGDKMAKEWGVKDGDYMVVQMSKVPVTIQPSGGGDPVEIMVDPAVDTIADIKNELERATGIPAKDQRLLKDGKELDKSKKMAGECGIEAGTVLDLERKSIQVQVDMPDGTQVSLKLKPQDTVEDIKKKIKKETGMGTSKQLLKLNGEEMPKKSTVADLGLTEGDTIQVEPKSISLNVQMPDGKKVPIEISPKDTAKKIKAKIEKETGMPATRQVLRDKSGNELGGKKSSETAKDMGLSDNDDLVVDIRKVPVTVKTINGEKIKVMVDPLEDTIGEIKQQVEQESGVPAANQRLFHDGKELDDDAKTASDCGLDKNSKLDMEPKVMSITAELPDGTSKSVDISPSDDCQGIKKKIEAATGISAKKQVLSKNGSQLKDGKTAKEMQLVPGDTIQVAKTSKSVNFSLADGSSRALDVEPNAPLIDISEFDWSRHVIKNKDGKELDMTKSLAELGIDDDEVLQVAKKSKSVMFNLPDGSSKEVDLYDDAPLSDVPDIDWSRHVVKNKAGQVLDPSKNAKELDIGDDEVLQVAKKSKSVMFNLPDGSSKEVDLYDDAPLSDVPDIDWSRHVVKNKAGQVLDPSKSAKELGIGDDEVLQVAKKSKSVMFNLPDGSSKEVDLYDDAPLSDVPDIDWSRHVVKNKDGKELDTSKTPEELGIGDDEVLQVAKKPKSVTLELPNGSNKAVDLDADTPLSDLKSKVPELDWSRHVVKNKDGKQLDTSKTPEELGIGDDEVLQVAKKPKSVTLELPDGSNKAVDLDADTPLSDLKSKIPELDWSRHVVKNKDGKELDTSKTPEELGIGDDEVLQVAKKPKSVTLELPDGSNKAVDLDADTPLSDLKSKIPELDWSRHVVKNKDGKQLDTSKTPEELGIGDDEVLQVAKKPKSVTLELPDGSNKAVDLDADTPLSDLKSKIPEVDWSRHMLKNNAGEELDISKTPEELGIYDDEVLQVAKKPKSITLELPDGSSKAVDLDADAPLSDLKSMVPELDWSRHVVKNKDGKELDTSKTPEELGIGDDEVLQVAKKPKSITLELPDGSSKAVDLDAGAPLSDLKSKVPEVDWSQHTVKHKGGKELDMSKSPQELGIYDDEVLQVAKKSKSVTLELPDGSTKSLEVEEEHTLKDIQDALPGVEWSRFAVKKNGDPVEPGKTMESLGIADGDVLTVAKKPQSISIELPDGSAKALDVEEEHTLKDIQDALPGVEWSRFAVKKNGDPVEPGKTMESLGIAEGDVLTVAKKPQSISIELPDGSAKALDVEEEHTLKDIQDALPGVEWSRFAVKKNGDPVEPGKTMESLGIAEGDVLTVAKKPQSISIELPDGSTKALDVEEEHTLKDIQDSLPGVEWSRFAVKKNGDPVEPGKTMESLGIAEGNVLTVAKKPRSISIELPDGSTKSLEVEEEHTLKDIQDALPGVEWSRFAVKKNGDPVEPGKTMESLGIADGDVLTVAKKPQSISIELPDGSAKALDVEEEHTLKDIQDALPGVEWSRFAVKKNGDPVEPGKTMESLGIAEGDVLTVAKKPQSISIELPDGSTKALDVEEEHTLKDIQDSLPGVEWSRFAVKKNGDPVEPGKTMESLGIAEGNVLTVAKKPRSISIELPDGSTKALDVEEEHTLKDIQDSLPGVEWSRFAVKKNGNPVEPDKTMESLGIADGDVLTVAKKPQSISIELPDGSAKALDVEEEHTLKDIQDALPGVEWSRFAVKKNGSPVEPGKTMESLGIVEGDILQLEPKSINASVLMPGGKKVPIAVKPSDTAGDIKKLIEKKTGTPTGSQTLKMFGDAMPDGKTVADMNLHEGDDNLEVEVSKPKAINVHVLMPDGEKVTIKVKQSNDADDIKDKIAGVTGTPRDKQILKMFGETVPDEKTVEEMDLHEGDESLEVEIARDKELSYRHRRPVEDDSDRQDSDSDDSSKDNDVKKMRRISARPKAKAPRPTMGDTPLERAYRWYVRIMSPSYKGMIKAVRNTPGIDITVEDVKLLPWIKKGLILDYELLTEMLEEIQAKRKEITGLAF